jgi:hypothetical protein
MWHAETSALVLRLYAAAGDYERCNPFSCVAFAKTIGPGVVFVEGVLRVEGKPMRISDWASMARMLREQHGIHTIRAFRHGKIVEFDTARAVQASAPVAECDLA